MCVVLCAVVAVRACLACRYADDNRNSWSEKRGECMKTTTRMMTMVVVIGTITIKKVPKRRWKRPVRLHSTCKKERR